jgi:hypothetical protein
VKKLKKVYLTHCSAKKDTSLVDNPKKVQPMNLYTKTPTKRFMNRCQSVGVNWAIFSDKYGIWHSGIRHEWYEKNPNSISDKEFKALLNNFGKSLSKFDEICFYYNPGRFHRVYKKLIKSSSLKNRIKPFTHIKDIRK